MNKLDLSIDKFVLILKKIFSPGLNNIIIVLEMANKKKRCLLYGKISIFILSETTGLCPKDIIGMCS